MALLAAALGAASLAQAPAASALVQTVSGTTVGLQPREVSAVYAGGQGSSRPSVRTFSNPSANPVLHSANVYAIYWDPQDYYHGDWQGVIDTFFTNLDAAGGQLSNEFALDAQYRDSSNQPATTHAIFHGAYTDTNPYPGAVCTNPHPLHGGAPLQEGHSVCLTDAQIRTQLQTFIAQHALPAGMGSVYYLLTPPGVAACLDAASTHCSDFPGTIEEVEKDEAAKAKAEERHEEYVEPPNLIAYHRSFCSYHSAIGGGGAETLLYAAIPWVAGGAGDPHLFAGEPSTTDQTQAYECQDGGFVPSTKPGGGVERAHAPEHTPKEEEEFAHKSEQEKREQREAEALGLSGPHDEEPNQLGSQIGPGGGYDHGLADLIVGQIAAEQHNIVTDPLLNAWRDSAGYESTDECRNLFLPVEGGSSTANPFTHAGSMFNQTLNFKNYYLNDQFNMAAFRLPYPGVPCMLGAALEASFDMPSPVNSGELVGFDGMESLITLGATPTNGNGQETYATYTWNFGDGTPPITGYAPGAAGANSPATGPCEVPWLTPCAGSEFHSYQYGGTYNVTLTVTDVAGNSASTTRPVTVIGPPPPAPASGGAGAAGGAGAGSSASGAGGKPGAPLLGASASILSRSLRSVLKSGLVVRYSVSERVTGRFEVLIATAKARHYHLHGTPATGLPAGTPAQTVIGRAVLVTTSGGAHTVRIVFSKTIASHLSKLRSTTLLLRLVARNASGGAASVLTPIKLSG